jgi:26S proteasome regulatory subunit N1
VQAFLNLCGNHLEKGNNHQAPTVLGITLLAMVEEVGLDMAIRSLEHLLQHGEQNIHQVMPLALGIFSISNPKVKLFNVTL